jgi:chaperonin cofactor prefoldin
MDCLGNIICDVLKYCSIQNCFTVNEDGQCISNATYFDHSLVPFIHVPDTNYIVLVSANFFLISSSYRYPSSPLCQQSLDRLDDASTELMMSSDSSQVMLLIGESFFETSEEDATEYCESEVERMSELLEKFDEEESTILAEQSELKKVLYGRFGKSIQLEEK